MSLNQKKILIGVLLALGAIVGVIGALSERTWLAVAGVLVMIGSVIFYFAGWVCPYCGGHLGRIDSGGDYCPHCGERLDFNERTGRKP